MRGLAVRRGEVVLIGVEPRGAVLETLVCAVDGQAFVKALGRSIVAAGYLPLDGLGAALLGDDVYNAAQRFGAIKHRGRALDDLDAFNDGRVNEQGRAVHGFVFGNFLPVNENKHAGGVFAAQGYALQPLRTRIDNLHAGNVFQKAANSCRCRFLDLFLGDHADRHGHVEQFLFHP